MTDNGALVSIIVEHWKILRAFERAIEKLPEQYAGRATAQLRYSTGKFETLLSETSLQLVIFDGKPYQPNLPATALNIDDFEDVESLTVDSTIEPAIVANMKILHLGKVTVKQFPDGGE